MRPMIRHWIAKNSAVSGRHRIGEEGDTLLEILVALVIISLSVVALLGVLTTSITTRPSSEV